MITRSISAPNTAFQLADTGIYEVTFQAPMALTGQLGLALDGAVVGYTVVGTDATSQLAGEALIQTTTPGEVLTVENPPGGLGNTVYIRGSEGGVNISESLVIKLLTTS